MLPDEMREQLETKIAAEDHPSELAIEVMYTLQNYYGYLSDEAVGEAAELLKMTPLEIDELATFYDFIYREPVGKYVIRVCDSSICWMYGCESVMEYLSEKLGIGPGETTVDGLFTLLPVCCVGFCDHAPVMLINGKLYGDLTPDSIDQALETLRLEQPRPAEVR
jgi:NADH-quinone oxidoreductase subunit E